VKELIGKAIYEGRISLKQLEQYIIELLCKDELKCVYPKKQ
jgi:hypothetical protein